VPAQTNLALCLLNQNQLDNARKEYEKLRQLQPRDKNAAMGLAYIAETQGRWDDALKEYENGKNGSRTTLNLCFEVRGYGSSGTNCPRL